MPRLRNRISLGKRFLSFTEILQKTSFLYKRVLLSLHPFFIVKIDRFCEYIGHVRKEFAMRLQKWLLAGVLVLGVSALFAGCGDSSSPAKEGKAEAKTTTITGSGSSALLPLARKGAAAFKEKNPNVSITLTAGGSGTGLKQVAEGSVDIGNSDVAAEKKLPPEKAKELVDHKVCTVTVAAIVNKDIAASVKSLSKDQLKDIFAARVTNWKEVGGPDEKIMIITRPATSGTRALFTDYALDGMKETAQATLETDDNGTLIENVAQTKGAIGYVALPYVRNSSLVDVIAIDGVLPSLENTYNGTYPVWGYEHMYTKGEAKGAIKEYIEFFMSDAFGPTIEELGYGITKKMTVSR